MTTKNVTVVYSDGHGRGAADRMRGMRSIAGILTTEHAASSYGCPVLLIDGIPHGPADVATKFPGAAISLEQPKNGDRQWAREHGWNVV